MPQLTEETERERGEWAVELKAAVGTHTRYISK